MTYRKMISLLAEAALIEQKKIDLSTFSLFHYFCRPNKNEK